MVSLCNIYVSCCIGERSTMDQQIPLSAAAFQPQQQQQQSFPPFMMNDPRFNPFFNPNAMNQQSRMIPQNNFMDPWFGNQQQQDPRMMQQQQPLWSGPPVQSDWTEMILIFPDGSAQRTFRDRLSVSFISQLLFIFKWLILLTWLKMLRVLARR